jgi:hypothetical protein
MAMLGRILGFHKGQQQAPAEPVGEPARSGKSGGDKGGGSGQKNALTVNEFVARTKRARDRGLEPTKPELIAYARYLGIDPITDGDLMWIADEALNAPLPSEWTEHHDSADRVFYYNVQTHASSWTHPLEQLHRDTYKSIISFRSGDLSKEDQAEELEKLRRRCDEAEREAHKELQAWTEHTDEQGQKFYYNRDQQTSVWTDPRPARCHSLYLQMKALRVLSKHCGQAMSSMGAEPVKAEKEHYSKSFKIRESPPPAEGALDLEEGEGKKRKKKKHRDEHLSAASRDPLSGDESLGGLNTKPKEWGSAKPSIAAVEEVRATLGLGADKGRLASPPGDGLSSVGRAKVRPGLRLDPIG